MKNFFYGLGGLSYSVVGQTITNFFMFFATSVLGLSGTLVGICIAISTIWDGLSDTIIGFCSDNYSMGRLGKRNGYMLIATIGMSVFNIALWCVPSDVGVGVKFVWILISLVLLETFNTMFATPYGALANELATSYDDRTKINSNKTIFYLLGVIIPSVLMVIFLPNSDEYPIGQLNPNGYKNIAIVTSSICLLFGLICSIFSLPNRTQNAYIKRKKKFSLKELVRGFIKTFQNKRLSKLILGYVFTSIATVFLCSVGLHFFTYSFMYTSRQITTILLTLLTGTMVSQPLWVFVSKRQKKKPALILGILTTIFAVFGVIVIYFFRVELYYVSFYIMLLLVFICGIGSGALYTLPVALYGDAIDNINKGSDGNNASYIGVLTFASNIAGAVAQLIVGVLLDIIKFDSTIAVQTLGVQTGLALILFVGVQSSLIIGCSVFAGYKEKGEKN